MSVSTPHRLYSDRLVDVEAVRDCVEGERAIKRRAEVGNGSDRAGGNLLALAGTRYLPAPNSDDMSEENQLRYRAYLKRASFVNFTGNTADGFLGMAFRLDPEVDLQPQLEYLLENADGNGLPLEQLARRQVSEVLETGRNGILVDYPTTEAGLTQQQVAALNNRAYLVPYKFEQIINWRVAMAGGRRILSMVVLMEEVEQLEGYVARCEKQYRVLMINEAGNYQQQLLDKDGVPLTDPVEPRKSDGSPWREIPFAWCGAVNNDETPDKPVLLDIARVNIAHYRNSADFEESAFMVGQPTPWASGLTQSWVDQNMKEGIRVGSRAVVLLPEGGAFGLAQANENQLPSKGMKDKEEQLVKIGAAIIRDSTSDMRVDQANQNFAGKTSKLSTVVGNVEASMWRALMWAGEFMGGEPEEFKLNREFYPRTTDPQAVMAAIALLDRGIIAESDLRAKLRRSEWIDPERTDDDIDDDIDGEMDPLA